MQSSFKRVWPHIITLRPSSGVKADERSAGCRDRARRIFEEFYADAEPWPKLHLERRTRELATSPLNSTLAAHLVRLVKKSIGRSALLGSVATGGPCHAYPRPEQSRRQERVGPLHRWFDTRPSHRA